MPLLRIDDRVHRFLSIVYDTIVNPGHWTEEMRKDALLPAKLEWPHLDTVDVGGGTGFCTIGIIEAGVKPENVVLIDQSPHQLAKARSEYVDDQMIRSE